MKALQGLAWLLVFQAIGEGLGHVLHWPFPGPVVGLIVLLAALRVPGVREPVAQASHLLLSNLSLLFVPVGVGIVTHLSLVSRYGVQLLVVIAVSTWIGLAVTGLLLQRLLRGDDAAPALPSGVRNE